MKKMCSILALLAFAALGLAAQNADVAGDWQLTLQTPRGERSMDMSIVQEGEKITVTMRGMRGGESTGEGTIKGNAIEWSITRSTPRGEFTSSYKGTVEGDTMSGTVEMGNFGTMEWTATKK